MTQSSRKRKEVLRQLSLERGEDPKHIALLDAIGQILDCDIPEAREAAFERFYDFVASRELESLAVWRGEHRSKKERWFFGCYRGIYIDVRSAMGAAYYHADQLRKLQDLVTAALAEHNAPELLARSTVGLGYTRKLDCEYHAFVLAFRRCLDYLAGALGSYFLTEADSFRTFPKSIAKKNPRDVAAALIEAHARHLPRLQFVLAPGRKSVRHQIAHYQFVSAGCVNLRPDGFVLVGGPEDPTWPPQGNIVDLNTALQERLDLLHACVDDMIDTFLAAAKIELRKEAEVPTSSQ